MFFNSFIRLSLKDSIICKVLSVEEGTTNVVDLNKIIENFEFVKANTEFTSELITAKITASGIIVKIDNETLGVDNSTDESGNIIDKTSFVIDDVKNVVAVQASVSEGEGNRTCVYMLNSSNHFYQSVFYAGPDNNHDVATYKYDITGVESFLVMNTPLVNGAEGELKYVLVKTADGKYYTDYPFDETFTIREIVNVSEVTEEPQDTPNEQTQVVETEEETTE